jgi:rhodanese-related sulfurtransferase
MRLRIIVGILLLASVIAVGLALGCSQPEQAGNYTDLSAAEAKQLIDENPDVIIIDVSPYYEAGHQPGAVSYYLGDGSLDVAIPMLEKDATYLVYCHGEDPSRQGAQKLVDAGFMNVYRLDGNYQAWVDAGYPIET